MTETVKTKKYTIKQFAVAGEHEHYVSDDTLKLLHNGDFVRLSVKQRPEVAKVVLKINVVVAWHTEEIGGASKTDYASKTVTLDSTTDYELKCKEQKREALRSMGIQSDADKSAFIDNNDITVTLSDVIMMDGSTATIGQEPTTESGVPWEAIINAVGWGFGIAALCMGVYVGYRAYRHWQHGEAMFPRIQAAFKGGDGP